MHRVHDLRRLHRLRGVCLRRLCELLRRLRLLPGTTRPPLPRLPPPAADASLLRSGLRRDVRLPGLLRLLSSEL